MARLHLEFYLRFCKHNKVTADNRLHLYYDWSPFDGNQGRRGWTCLVVVGAPMVATLAVRQGYPGNFPWQKKLPGPSQRLLFMLLSCRFSDIKTCDFGKLCRAGRIRGEKSFGLCGTPGIFSRQCYNSTGTRRQR
jgi:hypothetical protein